MDRHMAADGSVGHQSLPAVVKAIAVLGDGSVVAAGLFDRVGPGPVLPVSNVARWTSELSQIGHWTPLGDGVAGPIEAIVVDENGGVVVAGTGSTGTNATRFWRWNGTEWTVLRTEPSPAPVGVVPLSILALPGAGRGRTASCGGTRVRGGFHATCLDEFL